MGPRSTRAAAGMVAAGLALGGAAIDRHRAGRPVATVAGGTAGLAYLVATMFPRTPLFGARTRVERRDGSFALTFDDGPDPHDTPTISRVLAERGHQATFFVLGRAVREYPEILRAVVAHGHEIACHGDDHRLLAFARPKHVSQQIKRCERAVVAATGSPPVPLFRPPHGVRSPWLTRVAASHGYRVCAWDGSVFDTADPGADVIVARVTRLLRPGAVILLHDGDAAGRIGSRRQTIDALPGILAAAERRGLFSVGVASLVVDNLEVETLPVSRSS